ncbi:MAG: precorrin-3B synthase [Proteobacteria bacterium]|nr:precorrin-3B synthase [Pseudomonadota bacterium]
MSAPVIQGWCPGALRPMMSGDGLVVRIRAHLGRLTRAQAMEIARLSRAFGNGLIDLSARANLQLRGVRVDSHPPLIEGLAALGLIDADAAREARRNIVLSPFWRENDATPRLARALETALAAPDAPALPSKFGFAVDCGPAPVLRDISTDIRLERDAQGDLLVIADGAPHGLRVSEAEAISAAIALARWFLASGGAPEGRGRMRKHLAKVSLPENFARHARNPDSLTPPLPGLHPQGALIGFAFGQMQAETLAALAHLGNLRITPWRMLLVEGATTLPDLPEIITRGDDPMLRVIACTGAPGCVQAHQPTRALARALAPLIRKQGLLHLSGCAKGCAHPDPAPLTLVATPEGFDLIRDGNAAAPPAITGLPPDPNDILKAL